MIDSLITSKTRIKLLLRFFLNKDATGYLRGLEQEFGESSNAIRVELNRFEESGLLNSRILGNKKMYCSNTKHPLYQDISNIIRKYVGLDQIVENIASKLGDLNAVYLVGSLAKGLNSDVVDILCVGSIDMNYLVELIAKVEPIIKRKIRYVIYPSLSAVNWSDFDDEYLLLWEETL